MIQATAAGNDHQIDSQDDDDEIITRGLIVGGVWRRADGGEQAPWWSIFVKNVKRASPLLSMLVHFALAEDL